jgi:multidrug efflux system outer membrane protein
MVVLLSGCMVGPDYQRPQVTTPGLFRGSTATAPAAQSTGDLKWFEVFKDEQLQELIRTAIVQNYDLRDAIARVDAARANLGITQADQYPNFGIGADVIANEQSRRGQFTIPRGASGERSFTTVFLNLFTFEIDIWGRLRRATESARAQLFATDWNRKTVVTTLISDVATAYFSLLELDMELAIARNTLTTRAESLRLIKVQQRGGIATLLGVRQGEQLVYSAAESIHCSMPWMLTATCSTLNLSLAQIRLSELLSLVQLYRTLAGG